MLLLLQPNLKLLQSFAPLGLHHTQGPVSEPLWQTMVDC